MNIEKLTEKTIGFLRRFGNLDNDAPPRFRGNDIRGGPITSLGVRPPHCFDPMHYQQPVSGDDVYAGHYARVQEGLQEMIFYELHKLPLKEIPDSEECVLIDIGSGLGRQKTRPVAKAKPNLKVYMVDRLKKEHIENEWEYRQVDNPEFAGQGFERRIPFNLDVETTFNELLSANGLGNIIYVHKDLEILDSDTNLGELSEITRTRRVFFTGYMNPGGLGNITASEAVYHKAEKIYFNNTALERIEPFSESFNLMKNFLKDKLTAPEIKKVIDLMYDPGDLGRMNELYKYNYDVKPQKQFAIVLKQLFVLAQVNFLHKNGLTAQLFLDKKEGEKGLFGNCYNSQDHHIIAQKED